MLFSKTETIEKITSALEFIRNEMQVIGISQREDFYVNDAAVDGYNIFKIIF